MTQILSGLVTGLFEALPLTVAVMVVASIIPWDMMSKWLKKIVALVLVGSALWYLVDNVVHPRNGGYDEPEHEYFP